MPSTSTSNGRDVGDTKIFVLDTSVILHDGAVLEQLDDNDIAVPITVLEELDGFKKGNNVLSQHAREFLRRLDALSEEGDPDLRDWLRIREDLGRLCVISEEADSDQLMLGLRGRSNDHRILGAALSMQAREPNRKVILISKDINLRVKARALGLKAEDYENTQVSVEHLYPGMSVEYVHEDEVIDELYAEGVMPLSRLPDADWPLNHHLILKGPNRSALASRGLNGSIRLVRKMTAFGITPRNAEQIFALNAVLNEEVPLVTLTGGAGTGKTLLALAGALERRRRYRQILLARPIVPLSNRDLGYLPGDVDSKVGPYMQPLWDNLSVIRGSFGSGHREAQRLDEMLEQEKLQITPLAYIRGRSLNRCLFIIDEAQNLTPHEIKTIITRAGEGTKVVFTGDIFQIDTPYLDAQSNGLSYLVDRMKGNELYTHVNLQKGERSELANLAQELL